MGALSDSNAPGSATRLGRVTIAQVAAETGLAKGTVSRALNDYPDIAQGTKKRVLAAARALGYSPMAHAQAIRTGRVRAVGLVLQIEQHDAQRPFLTDFLQGISTGASQEGWTLTVATASSQAEGLETYRRLIADRKADGFILPRTLMDDPRAKLLRENDVPFVLFGRTEDAAGCAWFDIRGEDAMRKAVLRLAGQGHRRIGYLGGDTAFTFAVLREEGFRQGMAEAGLSVDEDLLLEGARDVKGGEAVVGRRHGVLGRLFVAEEGRVAARHGRDDPRHGRRRAGGPPPLVGRALAGGPVVRRDRVGPSGVGAQRRRWLAPAPDPGAARLLLAARATWTTGR